MAEIEVKLDVPFPVESATARDIMAFFDSEHELHSMDGAEVKDSGFVFHCSCGEDVKAPKLDEILPKGRFAEIKDRLSLKKLGQIGRVK